MKKLMQHFPAVVVAILSAILIFPQTAFAQDASQIAMQNAQQANQQAVDAAQQANQQAMQASQQAMQTATDNATPATAISRQQPPPSAFPVGPVPAQIAAAHTVFLTNAGADANFPVDENKAYSDVAKALDNWGRYQLVSSPQQADLIFSLRDTAPINGVTGYNGAVYSTNAPAFQLVIVDAKSGVSLWTVTSPVLLAGRGKTYARWYGLAVANLISRVKVLARQPLTAQETTDLVTYPRSHGLRNGLIIAGAGVAASAIIVVVSRAHAKSSQDAFCNANNIPLSMCAGG